MKGELKGAGEINLVDVRKSIAKVIDRQNLSTVVKKVGGVDNLRIATSISGDLTSVVLFTNINGKIYFGLGSSKRSMKDPFVITRGIAIAANRAIVDLNLELEGITE